jgi:hypothetical protein
VDAVAERLRSQMGAFAAQADVARVGEEGLKSAQGLWGGLGGRCLN